MTIFTTWALRLFGLSGVIGSILFIFGDLLYNHVPGSKNTPAEKMSRLPASRLLNAGTFGLIGCWFYTLASLHLYIAFRPAGNIFAFIFLIAFAATMICYGISHAAYFAIATGAKVAAKLGSDAESGGNLGNAFFKRMVNITYIPVAIFSLMMIYGIVTGRSMYPRWMVVFLPIVIYLLKTPVVRILKGRLQEIINDSYDNIVLFVFYVLSTIVLWNGFVS
ncbi:MAG: DUF6796 family protein [Chloroflexota bacterium]